MKRLSIILRTLPLLLAGALIHAQADGATDQRDSKGSPTAPALIAPENNKVFQKQKAKDPISFKWAEPVPAPAVGDVVYQLKIWQVAKGQTATQAIKGGTPIVQKDIEKATEASIPSRSFPRGPNSTFAWTVQAANKEGKVFWVTEPAILSIQSADITITNFVIKCGAALGTYTYTLTVTNFGTNNFVITSLPPFSGGSISSFTIAPSPAGKVVTTGAGNAVTFTGGFTATYPAAIYATVSGHQVGNINLPSMDTDMVDLPACVCSACDGVKWKPGPATPTLQGNSINIIQPFNPTGPGTIVAVKAEIISFARSVNDNCMTCTKDWHEWGNFTGGTFANLLGGLGNAVPPVTGSTRHSLYWSNPTGLPPNSSFNLAISTPPLSNLACCCDSVTFSIRYTYTFRNPQSGICVVCSVVQNYAVRKGNCPPDTSNKQ